MLQRAEDALLAGQQGMPTAVQRMPCYRARPCTQKAHYTVAQSTNNCSCALATAAPFHPPPPACRRRLQSEIRVSVEGNVVRFGHQAHPDREQKDEKEEGIFHRSERVRWGTTASAQRAHQVGHCQGGRTSASGFLIASQTDAGASPLTSTALMLRPHPTRLHTHTPLSPPSAAPSEAAPCACPTTPTWRPSRPRLGGTGVLLCCLCSTAVVLLLPWFGLAAIKLAPDCTACSTRTVWCTSRRRLV